jgi:hypothetical protein
MIHTSSADTSWPYYYDTNTDKAYERFLDSYWPMLRVRPYSRNLYKLSNDYTDTVSLSILPTTNSVRLASPPAAAAILSPSPERPPEAQSPRVLGLAQPRQKFPSHTFHLGNNRSFVTTITFTQGLVGRLHPSLISPSASRRNKMARQLSTAGTYLSQANHFSLAQESSQRVLHHSHHEH